MLVKLKHAMNSGYTEIHRFALPEGDANSDRNAHWKRENVQPRFSLPRPLGEVAQSKTVTERAAAYSTIH